MITALWVFGFVVPLLAAALVLQGAALHEAHLDLRHGRAGNAALEQQLDLYAAAFAERVERDLRGGDGYA